MFRLQAIHNILYRDRGNLNEAPREIIYSIFCFFNDGKELAIAGRTCKKWYYVARDHRLWETLVRSWVWAHDDFEFLRGAELRENEVPERDVIPCTRWKAMYIHHSELMWNNEYDRLKNKYLGRYLDIRVDGTWFYKTKQLEKLIGYCSGALQKVARRCEELQIYYYLEFSEDGLKKDEPQTWNQYLESNELFNAIEAAKQREMVKERETELKLRSSQRAAEILKISSVNRYEIHEEIIQMILNNEHLFTRTSHRNLNFLFGDIRQNLVFFSDSDSHSYSFDILMSFLEETPRNIIVSSKWNFNDFVSFVNNEKNMSTLESLVNEIEANSTRLRSENEQLTQKVQSHLNLENISFWAISLKQQNYCCNQLLRCPPRLVQSIRPSHLQLKICSSVKNYYQTSGYPIEIPWNATIEDIEKLLFYKPRYTDDDPIVPSHQRSFFWSSTPEEGRCKEFFIFKAKENLTEEEKQKGENRRKHLKRKLRDISNLERQQKKQKSSLDPEQIQLVANKIEIINELNALKAQLNPKDMLYKDASFCLYTLE